MDLDDFLGKAFNTMGNKMKEFREKSIKEQERCANMSDERLIRQFTSMSASSPIKQAATLEEIKHRGLQREANDALHHRKRYFRQTI